MARHDDIDIAHLFGLSREETLALGLDSAAPALEERAVLDGPEDTHTGGDAPLQHPRARRLDERFKARAGKPASRDEEQALMALLDGRAIDLAVRELEQQPVRDRAGEAEVTPAPTALPCADMTVEDKEATSPTPANVVYLTSTTVTSREQEWPAPRLSPLGDDVAPAMDVHASDVTDGLDDDVDVAALFGLSSDEAVAIGLTPYPDAHIQASERAEASAHEQAAASADIMGLDATDVDSPQDTGRGDDTTVTPVAEIPPPGAAPQVAPVWTAPGDEEAESVIEAPAHDMVGVNEAVASSDEVVVDPALLEAFGEESAELLEGLHVELERLERNASDYDALLEIRRIMHTVKGGAKMCGFEEVAALAHAAENLLDLVADRSVSLTGAVLRTLFSCEPMLFATVQGALTSQQQIEGSALAALIEELDMLCVPQADEAHRDVETVDDAAAFHARAASPASDPIERDTPSVDTPVSGLLPRDRGAPSEATWSPHERTLDRVVHDNTRPAEVPPPAAQSADPPRRGGRRGANSINVDLTKVDAVVAKVSEMAAHRASSQGMVTQLMEKVEDARRNVVRLQSIVAQLSNDYVVPHAEPVRGDDDLNLESYGGFATLVLQLQEAVSDQQAWVHAIHDTITGHWRLRASESRVDADIQSALMSIRLIPLASLRARLDGVVRQAAQATGKSVRWHMQGGNVALEKNVFDHLFEPLMHLLRNAVDHAIETPENRLAAGKPEAGSIVVAAAQQGNQIIVTVADDGAGIVPDRIARIAVDRGLITPDRAAVMSSRDKIDLIFAPGFSTAGSVSHLSGRGVGMDAVRETCARLGGSIDVSSNPGAGTTFTLRLPLSLAVTRGLIVRDGGSLMVFPVAQIIALHLVRADDIVDAPGGRVARIDGQELPVYSLPPLPGARPHDYPQHGEVNVLHVHHGTGSIGVLVEEVLDEEEVLIKAVPALLRGVSALQGAYVLPDGTVAPVVNLPHLLNDLRPASTLDRVPTKAPRGLTALVVDDSMSMRVALTGTLQSAGFTVLTARDGQEALDVLKREGLPHLVTLDVEMPRMDGLETLFAVRQMATAEQLPVFMMTSRGGAKHRRAAEQLGATRYFTKPYRDSELAAAAQEACHRALAG